MERFLQGSRLYEKKEYSKAISSFQQCVDRELYVEESYANIGVCYEALGDFQNAFRTYRIGRTRDAKRFDGCIKRLSAQCLDCPEVLEKIVAMYPTCYATNCRLSAQLINRILLHPSNRLLRILQQTCANEYQQTPDHDLTRTHLGYLYYLADENVLAIQYLSEIREKNVDIQYILLLAKLKVHAYAKSFETDLALVTGLDSLRRQDLLGCFYNANKPCHPNAKQLWRSYNSEQMKPRRLVTDWLHPKHIVPGTETMGEYTEKDMYILELKDVCIQGYSIYDAEHVYAGEKGYTKLPIPIPSSSSSLRIPTPILSLLQTNVANYYHWMAESLVHYMEVRDYVPDIEVAIPTQCPSFVRDSLAFLGINRIREVDVQKTYECSTLYKVDYTANDGHADNVFHIYSPSLRGLRMLRNSLQSKLVSTIPTKLVYVRRARGIRSVEHDAYLIDRLRETYKDDFVVFEHGTFQEQSALFSSAKMIFGPHGAGLTNMLFCPEGTTILELQLSPNCNTCFEYMANALGFPYIGHNGCTSYYYGMYTPTEQDLEALFHCIRSMFE